MLDSAGPGLDSAGLGLDSAGPGLDSAGPGLDSAGPGLDSAGPRLNSAGPGKDSAGPGLDASGDSGKGMVSLRFAKSSLSLDRDEAERRANATLGMTKSLPGVVVCPPSVSETQSCTEDKMQ